jgi:peroxidase
LGLLSDAASRFDPNLVHTLQNRLFEVTLSDGTVFALDLAATNINRGRDHGIPSYNAIRERCGLAKAKSFQDLADSIAADKIQALSSIYEHVDDIDFYVGGLSETAINGGIIGPSFACIVANQFKDLKIGDRFYYENGPSPTAFTLGKVYICVSI